MLRFADDITIRVQYKINFKKVTLKSKYKTKMNRKKQKLWLAPNTLKILVVK
jgi:hypothetical protein